MDAMEAACYRVRSTVHVHTSLLESNGGHRIPHAKCHQARVVRAGAVHALQTCSATPRFVAMAMGPSPWRGEGETHRRAPSIGLWFSHDPLLLERPGVTP